jgi:hypothetical protein
MKHWLLVVMIDSGSTHNFIHFRLADEIHCFVRLVSNFQILIANGGIMKCRATLSECQTPNGWLYSENPHVLYFHG